MGEEANQRTVRSRRRVQKRKAIDLDSEPEAEADSGAEEGWTPYGTKTGKTTSDEEPDDRQEPSDASDEEQKNTGETFRLGEQDEKFQDFRKSLEIKDDAVNRPLWVCPDGRIYLETFSPVYKPASDFLIAVAEPVCRPEVVHEYLLTPHSLYAAVSVGLTTGTIIAVLGKLSKAVLPPEIIKFIQQSTSNYGKVKLVLQHNKFFVESSDPTILKRMLNDPVISAARVHNEATEEGTSGFQMRSGVQDRGAAQLSAVATLDLTAGGGEGDGGTAGIGGDAAGQMDAPEEDADRQLHSFEIEGAQVEHVKAASLPGRLNYPMLEEYDFRNDHVNPRLDFELKPTVVHRPFQARAMSKMFGNGRARSGIIVLPCGAGKSLAGISAAARVKKSCLVLCTNSVSVDQWRYQFTLWSTLQADQVCRFTSEHKELMTAAANVCVTTYTMISFQGNRSEESRKVMDQIQSREWGLIILDEVHVVPAAMFRRVVGIIHAHTKLGLTATLVREDDRISDLNFLIGPKLYEANWQDLTRDGHIANVQCAEVWCPMTREFMREYMRLESAAKRQLLYVMNPQKFMACQFLIRFHEEQRGDKVIVFSDNIFALTKYAQALRRPLIYGGTSHAERTRVLHAFKNSPTVNTLFLSKVGDNSIDIPEANVLIQISSHAGSRRQEAQRLGRILRAKKTKPGAKVEEFDAFFYTLVSTDTQEMFYSTKRQQFLIDQGYAFKVITNLLDSAGQQELLYSQRDDQVNLLAQVLVAAEGDLQQDDVATDDVTTDRPAVRRTQGRLSAMSGAGNLSYIEYGRTGGRGRGRSGQPKKLHSKMFKKAMVR